MNAESLVHERGRVAVVAHKDQFTREEKDALRADSGIVQMGAYFAVLVAEEPDSDELALAAFEEFEDDKQDGDQSDEPTMEDLRGLTVAKLQELADKEEVDLSGLKLKDDILGRMAAHFGLDPAS